MQGLTELGPVAVPALRAALKDATAFRRRFAAETFARLALAEENHPYLWERIPDLLAALGDDDRHTRVRAARALRRLTDRSFGFPEEAAETSALSAAEEAAATAWRDFWAEVRGEVEAARSAADEPS